MFTTGPPVTVNKEVIAGVTAPARNATLVTAKRFRGVNPELIQQVGCRKF